MSSRAETRQVTKYHQILRTSTPPNKKNHQENLPQPKPCYPYKLNISSSISPVSSEKFLHVLIRDHRLKNPPLCTKKLKMSKSGGGGSSGSRAANCFEEFLGGWMVRQEHYLDELLTAQGNGYQCGEEYLNDLINRILSHYGQYYEEKSRFVRQNDVLLLFSPSWFTPFELAYLWVAGFKPGLALRVLRNSVHELCEEQDRKLSRVAEETRMEERQLNDWMAKIQESLAAPPLLKLARQSAWRMVDGERTERNDRVGEEIVRLRAEMESVVDRADLLRRSVVARVVEILNPVQNIQFLAAVTKLQLTVRKCGLAKDEEIRKSSRDWR